MRITSFISVVVFISLFSTIGIAGPLKNGSFQDERHIVFLISEDVDNYEAHRTIPLYADMLNREYGYRTTVLLGKGERTAFYFPNLEIIKEADLLVVFCRRVALKNAQMDLIRDFLREGKPLVGIRTANHAFSVREEVGKGYQSWWEFVPDILGCGNKGYGPRELGTKVNFDLKNRDHPIMQDIKGENWKSPGTLYLVSPLLDNNATVLLWGYYDEKFREPIAWTRTTTDRSKIFYTSLGYPTDFESKNFVLLLTNGLMWALGDL